MPINLPSLDDRRFDELVAAGKRMIPGLAPSWTDHNPSDPGITLIELFASIAELLMYRADRVSEANQQAFVRLLLGDPAWQPVKTMDEEIRAAVLTLRREERAVTAADFRALAEEYPHPSSEVKPVARAHCLPGCDARTEPPRFDVPAHVSVLIVPRSGGDRPLPDADLLAALAAYLAPRCLLTTRLHLAAPRYLSVRVRIRAHVFADQGEETVRQRVEERVSDYLHPLRGGADGRGWPFGRAVYVSDLYALLDGIDGVDYATMEAGEPVLRALDGGERTITEAGAFVGIRLEPNELVALAPFPPRTSPPPSPPAGPTADQSWIGVERLVAMLPEE